MMLTPAVVAGLLSHWIDAAVLFAAVVVNAIIDFIQEEKAEEALDAIRQAERIRIAVEDLVQGNLVALASGDKVPADIRALPAKNLLVNEAIRTSWDSRPPPSRSTRRWAIVAASSCWFTEREARIPCAISCSARRPSACCGPAGDRRWS